MMEYLQFITTTPITILSLKAYRVVKFIQKLFEIIITHLWCNIIDPTLEPILMERIMVA